MQPKHKHRPILIYGAYGHTAHFIIHELIDKSFIPVLCGRDQKKLEAVSSAHAGLEIRVASANDPIALKRALDGVDAVINAAGPFALTAPAVIGAAIKACVPYLDIAAEPDVVATMIEQHGEGAGHAGVALAPAIGFYGGLGNLLATAAMDDWSQADEISLAYSLSSWVPTSGTRVTIDAAEKRRGGQRLVFRNHRLELRNDEAPVIEWDFPAPIGRQTVTTEFTTADAVTISRHLKTQVISEYMTLAPLKDLSGPNLSRQQAVDDKGRSAQTFLVEAVVRSGTRERRAVARGQDIYAVTAPLVVQALQCLLAQPQRWRGIVTTGELGDARSYLNALAPQHLAVELE
jgi:short subunit dehydrogenase-like uncharacterized protein